MTGPLPLFLTLLAAQVSLVRSATPPHLPANVTALPYDPRPAPSYMVDNQHNYYHTAPDKGKQNGPVWRYSGSLEKFMTNLGKGTVIRGGYNGFNGTCHDLALMVATMGLQGSSIRINVGPTN
ncbi:hypothetical protein TsFJ059_008148 [Trichoderma semiorbis]|uniref:Uncharacterized protein n=1 Tax=Trichoderma semiorbis TaxID=1491008 RepID=A0A9P8HKC4_9HYPO|nr:hypothetical protein TsFJ059_008148 [Trichoderma semiorbis]